jgi:Family of unknown function (DUF6481)
MSGFRDQDQGFGDRRSAADSARKAMQQRFHATAGADDPALAEQKAARQAISAAREAAEQKARETAERELRLEQNAREIVERAERQAAVQVEQKAARDARYAAQKARK